MNNQSHDDMLLALGAPTWPLLVGPLAATLGWLVYLLVGMQPEGTIVALSPEAEMAWRVGGWLVPFALGATLGLGLNAPADGAFFTDYRLCLAPLVGPLGALMFAFRAFGGVVGGGTSVQSDGAHVTHAVEGKLRGLAAGSAALLFFVTAPSMLLAQRLVLKSLGADIP